MTECEIKKFLRDPERKRGDCICNNENGRKIMFISEGRYKKFEYDSANDVLKSFGMTTILDRAVEWIRR